MPLKITDYEIIRSVTPGRKGIVECPRGKPLRVLTLLDEADFLKELQPVHHRNVFFEDFVHDWNMNKDEKTLCYYSRVGECNDIVLVYAEEEVKFVPKFCMMTGKRLTAE